MENLRILSIEECSDKAYGETIVQYSCAGVVSFAFSQIPVEKALEDPFVLVKDLQTKLVKDESKPLWSDLSDKLLEAICENPFDMHFVEHGDEGWSEEIEDALFQEVGDRGLYGAVTCGEDGAFVTVYAGAMGSVDWRGHKYFGVPCLEHLVCESEVLKRKVNAELSAFKDRYISGQFDPKRIYEDWYVISFYEAYAELISSNYLEGRSLESEIKWLASMDSPLASLYDIWLHCDAAFSHDWDDMIDFVCVNYQDFSREQALIASEQVSPLNEIKKETVLFSSLLDSPVGPALDRHLEKNGWELQAWDTGTAQGYQLFLGKGVQVDNHYEYGFPYLYDKEELLAFADEFYKSRVCEQTPSLDEQISSASSLASATSAPIGEKEIASAPEL